MHKKQRFLRGSVSIKAHSKKLEELNSMGIVNELTFIAPLSCLHPPSRIVPRSFLDTKYNTFNHTFAVEIRKGAKYGSNLCHFFFY